MNKLGNVPSSIKEGHSLGSFRGCDAHHVSQPAFLKYITDIDACVCYDIIIIGSFQ